MARSRPARSPQSASRGAVFFDRDGCLNDDIGFLHEWPKFRWLPGAVEAVHAVNQAGFRAFVVTNQSGIARGLYSAAHVDEIHANMSRELAQHGAWIDAYRFCPHHPEHGERLVCNCRKPAPGMLIDLVQAWGIDTGRAFIVGDRTTDVEAGHSAGIRGFQVEPGNVLAVVRRELSRLT